MFKSTLPWRIEKKKNCENSQNCDQLFSADCVYSEQISYIKSAHYSVNYRKFTLIQHADKSHKMSSSSELKAA